MIRAQICLSRIPEGGLLEFRQRLGPAQQGFQVIETLPGRA